MVLSLHRMGMYLPSPAYVHSSSIPYAYLMNPFSMSQYDHNPPRLHASGVTCATCDHLCVHMRIICTSLARTCASINLVCMPTEYRWGAGQGSQAMGEDTGEINYGLDDKTPRIGVCID